MRAAVGVAALLLIGGCVDQREAATPSSPPPTGEIPADAGALASQLIERTNDARVTEGLEPLESAACADGEAEARARALVGSAELAHADLAPVIEECAPSSAAAENLVRASAESTGAEVVEAWLGSPGHRANLLDPDVTAMTVGCVEDGDGYLCSQLFIGP